MSLIHASQNIIYYVVFLIPQSCWILTSDWSRVLSHLFPIFFKRRSLLGAELDLIVIQLLLLTPSSWDALQHNANPAWNILWHLPSPSAGLLAGRRSWSRSDSTSFCAVRSCTPFPFSWSWVYPQHALCLLTQNNMRAQRAIGLNVTKTQS